MLFLIGFLSETTALHAQNVPYSPKTPVDTTHFKLLFPFRNYTGIPYLDTLSHSPFYLKTPPNIKKEIIYDPVTNTYKFISRFGNFEYRTPSVLNFKEYDKLDSTETLKNYWQQSALSRGTAVGTRLIPKIYVKSKAFQQIFGSNSIDIRPQGTADISMGVLSNYRDDPTLDVNQLRTTNFDFNEKIQMNVDARIGDKLSFKANYNTESSFNFENTLKLRYVGKKNDIIKSIQAGNVSMPLQSTLINGAQSLFGVKTKLQFGKTTVTAVFSQQQSQTKSITIQNGAEQNTFKLSALDYDNNRHFFLSQYFRDHYAQALKTLPIVSSDINITKIEVWVTNIGPATSQNRNIVAFTDLGEGKASEIFNPNVKPTPGNTFPTNQSNDLLSKMDTTQLRNINTVTSYLTGDPLQIGKTDYFTPGEDFVKLENARRLSPSEYTVNTKLGFITLNTALNNDQVLAVAFQYTVIGHNKVYQVGEFSDQGISSPNALIVKLLKSNTLDTHMPMWNLMMKNVYSIGAYQVQSNDFIFNILYSGNSQGVPTGYFTEGPAGVKGVPLIHVFGLDNLDQQMNPVSGGDGIFDFINGAETQGGTFQASDGDIYFTVLQPFGNYIRTHVFPNDPALADKYAFDSLYTMTKSQAEQYADKNKYLLEGSYKSQSGSTINLNAMNIPPGSVKVTAGGVPLQENVDYTVDYTMGQITILNQGILNSGTPIHVTLENNSAFNVQQKTMMGVHVDHEFTPDFHLGATFLNLHERPLTQKVNYGNDPISNSIWGMNLAYSKNARWISKMLSKLPGTTPNTPSKVNYNAEFAEFLPGHSRTVGKSGTSYVDDFEAAQSTIDLTNVQSWHLASTPQGQPDLFPEAAPNTGLAYGKNRALFAWYIIDPSVFYDIRGNDRPKNITKDEISKNSTRQVLENEVFPNKDIPNGTPTNIPVFNLAFFPSQRGEYNYDVYPGPYSAGILANGDLADPKTRWGGMMRALQTTDFQAANIQYIEFWMMDPFTSDPTNTGNLYIDLGDVSEDILRDGRMSDESGLPTSANSTTAVDTTLWGVVPQNPALVQSFSNIAGSRKYQDVGYDGLGDQAEREFFKNSFIDLIKQRFGTADSAYVKALKDPSADDYHYYRGTDYDNNPLYSSITERYKRYNAPEGNSTPGFPEPEPYSTVATNLPDKEDLNNDGTLNESERYYQYKIVLNPNDMKVGQDYITDVRHAGNIHLPNGKTTSVNWYEFKIPIHIPNKVVGNISGFQSIRFMRVFMRGFAKPIVVRFATFELVRGDWRTYDQSLLSPGEYLPTEAADKTQFVVSTVNLEENSNRSPIPYVIPPGIKREINYGTTNYIRLNEQSLQFTVENLQDGDSRAAYKNVSFDFRQYKYLRMFVHGEKLTADENIKDGDLEVFIRMGSDFTQNYYEYEIPLHLTPWYTSSADPNAIWPADNDMNINLAKLVQAKLDRDAAMRGGNSGVSLTLPYSESDGNAKITVVGNPNLADITGIMIGVQNPRQVGSTSADDGMPKSAIVWFDELRLTGFDKSPGWAATGRLEANLSDLGRFSASGSYRSAGFGSLDQHLNEISQNDVANYNLSTDLDLGKLFPKKAGMSIPLHVDYGKSIITPKYDPMNPDVLLKNEIATYDTKAGKDSIKNMAIDYTRTTSFSLMDVHKGRTSFSGKQKKPKLYDPENFNASFAYSQVLHHNTDIAMNRVKTYQGGFGYNFNTRPKSIEPFKKAKKMNSPWLRWLKDFNFNLIPSVISFRTNMDRLFNSMLYRNKSTADILIYPTYMRQWTWDRNYTLKYNLTKALGFEYTAGANAYIKEPEIYPDKNTAAWADYKREIWNQIESMGTLKNFNHSLQANYNFPLSKIPLTDWINLMGSYQVLYNWNASPLSVQSSFGNTIENSRSIQLNGGLDFNQLYNKIPFLKRINNHNNSSHRSFVRRFGPGAIQQRNQAQKKKKRGGKNVNVVERTIFRILMMLQDGNVVYRKSDGIQMSGFKPVPDFMGVNLAQDAPGLGFVFGSQKDIRNLAAQNGWITRDTTLNQPYITKLTEQLSYKLNGNILNAVTINLNGNRIFAKNYTSYFRFDPENNVFENFSPQEAGNFSMTYPFIRTSFDRSSVNNISKVFNQFKADRLIIANRLAQNDPHWSGKYVYDSLAGQLFPVGYSSTQQQVMYYAFLAAYSGKSASGIDIGHTFPAFPLPNWRLSFNGLTHIPAIRKLFRSFNMNFGYSSILSINAWNTNVNYDPENPGLLYPGTNNFVNRIDLGTVSFMEEYNPLIGIDFTMLNSLGGRVEYKKSRNIVLSFANDQITEVDGNELDVGLSYHLKGLKLAVRNFTGRPTRKYNTDLNLKLDVGVQDNKTILRQIDQEDNQISAGSRQYTVNFAADYLLSQNLQLRAYFNWNENNPYVSSQYLNSTTSGGLTLRFLIGQ